jgi:hypothetical protein
MSNPCEQSDTEEPAVIFVVSAGHCGDSVISEPSDTAQRCLDVIRADRLGPPPPQRTTAMMTLREFIDLLEDEVAGTSNISDAEFTQAMVDAFKDINRRLIALESAALAPVAVKMQDIMRHDVVRQGTQRHARQCA